MYKFAHLADCHLGSQKQTELKELEFKAFNDAMDKCIQEKVDFIIIAGDLFHSNLPDMNIVKKTVAKLKEVNENDIPIYINYGSHDFSPNATSIIDVITESGLLKNIYNPEIVELENAEQKIGLSFTVDKKTQCKLTGIIGRKIGLEEDIFKSLDRNGLKNEDGFKIFVFHTGIKELMPDFLSKMDGISIKKFPSGFNYYAGGHIHKKVCSKSLEGRGPIVYPGSLFGGYPRDFELSAKGEKRGFFIVEFENDISSINFHEITVSKYEFISLKVNDETSYQFHDRVLNEIKKKDVNNKIVILKLEGELSGGKTSDVNFFEIRKTLRDNGAISINLNHHSLKSKEFSNITTKGENKTEIEENILRENIGTVNINIESLKGDKGTQKAYELVNILRNSSKLNEKKQDYRNRVIKDALKILDIEELPNDI